jgi:hypothetical protein
MNWQPIDTAPKDGTKILVFDGVDMTTVRWMDGRSEWWPGEWQLVCAGMNAEECEFYKPTHWMPLPEPPQ